MIKVFQTRFGGKDAPTEKQGNCFRACVATILQMPLEEAFDCIGVQDDRQEWLTEFNKWLEKYGLGCIWLESSKENPAICTAFVGLHIAECMSTTLYCGTRHVVVVRDGLLFHDPNPNATKQGEMQGIYIFVPLEAHRLVRTKNAEIS